MKGLNIEEPKVVDEKDEDTEDFIVKSIGSFGRWQFIFCFIVTMSRFIAMWNLMSILFLTATTDFKCVKFQSDSLELTSTLANQTIEGEMSVCYENCLEYTYNQSVFENTLISEFGLICEREWMASFLQTIMMFGLVLGISIFGWISDKYGRSKTLYSSTVFNVILLFIVQFSPNYWIFATLRFFIGLATGGIMTSTAVYILETVGPEVKEIAGSLSLLIDNISTISLALFAYLAPTWKWYLLEYSSVSVVILIAMFFIPETPRWLIATRKSERAISLMTKAAIFNGRSTSEIKENVLKSIEALKTNDQSVTLTYLDLFRTKRSAIITLSSVVVWFMTGACYFGINQYVTLLGSNIFIVVTMSALTQIPSIPVAIMVTKAFNRRISTIVTLLVLSATMIILIFIPQGTWVCTIIGIFGASTANTLFPIVYIYVIELYPTPLRNMGFGLSAAGSKFGAMLAPFIANFRLHWVAALIFAMLALVGVAFCLLLPETKGKKLRDDLDE